MKKVKESGSRPATTVEGRDNQLINLAVSLAEKQLREGTAAPSVISHYLKMGSLKAQAEKRLLEAQIKLAEAKTEALQTGKKLDELYSEAMKALSDYKGEDNPDDKDIL